VRGVGSSYHAATEGLAAADHAFDILDEDRAAAATSARRQPQVDGSLVPGAVVMRGVSVVYGATDGVRDFSARFEPGVVTVLVGPSGAGKSSLIAALLGFAAFEGDIRLGAPAHPGPTVESRELVAWSGQRPGLVAGTIADNVALGTEDYSDERIRVALQTAAADELSPSMALGVGGSGLSGGQAQRVAIARAIYRLLERDCPVLVLDEPTSALDEPTEARLVLRLRELASAGRTVVVVSHRAAVIAAADAIVAVGELTHA
jgi:ATP-binding cassette subfamily C protein CydD